MYKQEWFPQASICERFLYQLDKLSQSCFDKQLSLGAVRCVGRTGSSKSRGRFCGMRLQGTYLRLTAVTGNAVGDLMQFLFLFQSFFFFFKPGNKPHLKFVDSDKVFFSFQQAAISQAHFVCTSGLWEGGVVIFGNLISTCQWCP